LRSTHLGHHPPLNRSRAGPHPLPRRSPSVCQRVLEDRKTRGPMNGRPLGLVHCKVKRSRRVESARATQYRRRGGSMGTWTSLQGCKCTKYNMHKGSLPSTVIRAVGMGKSGSERHVETVRDSYTHKRSTRFHLPLIRRRNYNFASRFTNSHRRLRLKIHSIIPRRRNGYRG
jgi:hypothetical protein